MYVHVCTVNTDTVLVLNTLLNYVQYVPGTHGTVLYSAYYSFFLMNESLGVIGIVSTVNCQQLSTVETIDRQSTSTCW